MSTRDCFWAKFKRKCETPRFPECQTPPKKCLWCGWDADAEWERCLQQESEIAQFVDEIIAGEEANNDLNWLPPF